jgi:hypothetical protein
MTQNINLSKKIKITIPDDPIFSGTYVFDYALGGGDGDLFSNNWILNSGESNHNLSPYSHNLNPPGDTGDPSYIAKFQNKILVSLNDQPQIDSQTYGYVEAQTSYYKDTIATSAHEIDEAYAFPAHFVFTAVQSSCPCSGDDAYDDLITAQPSGHRLAVGFAIPIRWRGSHQDWIAVDRIFHTINQTEFAGGGNINPNYVSGVPFNNGVTHYDPELSTNILPNNAVYLTYGTSYVPSTANTVIGSGIYTLDYTLGLDFFVNCTGIEDLGFAFRVSSSGGGVAITNNLPGLDIGSIMPGIGRYNIFTKNLNDQIDKSNFFGPKIPVGATIEFVDSCRPGRPCVNLTPDTVSPVQVSGICFSKSNIISNLFCGNIQASPSQSSLDSYEVSSISIIYSGVSIAYPAIKEPLGNYYDVYKTNINSPIIELLHESPISYTGIMDLINNRISVVEHGIAEEDPATYKNFLQYSDIELVWNVDAQNQKATVYIIPDLDAPYNNTSILVCGSDIQQVNGKYNWNNLNKIFNHYSSPDFHIIRQSLGISNKWILGSGNFDINNNSMWNPNSMDPLEWKTYYTLNNNIFSETTQTWSIDQNNIGTNPPPSSVAYCTVPRSC